MHKISEILQKWFIQNKRDLPWRATNDPYKIWISETILQQTRVVQGLNYYLRFVERFPDVKVLAEADEKEILLLWQGLGYYSRARNLHFAANQIVMWFHGKFPTDYNDILKLKGVGEYTAAAVCSIAYNQNVAVLDGNVYRVLARLFNEKTPIDSSEGKKLFSALAAELLDKNNASIHNQAMMEFGALQCVPQSPDCKNCVLQGKCLAFTRKNVENLPFKSKKTKISERFFNYLIVRCSDEILLNKRGTSDIWAGLYDFPMLESNHLLNKEELLENQHFVDYFPKNITTKILSQSVVYKHVLTHRRIFAQFFEITVSTFSPTLNKQFIKTKATEIHHFPLPRLIDRYLEDSAD
ncbi:MAG: A/G-specific adenine glycosylase [Bacteroidales bacterium]|jgi:A/G-specific adenine glycosylase|nr:A/G-specific adenine glycosylase [Bacteroidales bacterium]